jgi:UDP-N-acetylglucosamine 2-epimerase (non-hydrolysing)
VDDREILQGLLETLGTLSLRLPVLFPVHPRTRQRIADFHLQTLLENYRDLRLIEPLGYLDFLKCMDHARFVITDSGGIQEETSVLGVPCITARDNTERPITVSEGTNVIAGRDPRRILEEAYRLLAGEQRSGRRPALWDGKASKRIVHILWEREGVGLPG